MGAGSSCAAAGPPSSRIGLGGCFGSTGSSSAADAGGLGLAAAAAPSPSSSRAHQIREHRRAIFDSGNGQSTAACPLGIHQIGRCTCDSFLVAEESSARASVSRIVMLTEALFEVLDEIHRQSSSLSLSMVSVQAPESVVNSLPCKSYKKLETAQRNADLEQCHICLTEYEDGDQIRTLPCKHEFHLQCVDKWLKEVHRVCPLCRGDVCEGGAS